MQLLKQQPSAVAGSTVAQSGHTAVALPVVAETPEGQAFVEAALRRATPRRVRYSFAVRCWRGGVTNATLAVFASVYAFCPVRTNLLSTEIRKLLLFALIVSGEFCVIAVIGTLVTLPRMRRQAHLLRSGVAVTGTVVATPVEIWHDADGNNVTYTFQTLKGTSVTRTVSVRPEVSRRLAVGSQTTILYDPSNDEVSYPYNAITCAELT